MPYYVVQLIILGAALCIALEIQALRGRHGDSAAVGEAVDHRALVALVVNGALVALVISGFQLDRPLFDPGSTVHHASNGMPPLVTPEVALSVERSDNHLVRTSASLLASVMAGTVFVGSGSAGHRTPIALYRALITAPLPASSLPFGFSPPVGAQKVAASPDSRAHHVVGVVQIFLNGGAYRGVSYAAGAYYDVFPDRQDALADYRAETGNARAVSLNSFPSPARSVDTSLPNGGIRYLGVEFVDQNVRVFSYVANRGESPLPRNALALAVSLGKVMLKHLEHVRSGG